MNTQKGSLKNILFSLSAWLLPSWILRRILDEVNFAFIVHPRDLQDIARKFPFVDNLPRWLVERSFNYLGPVLVSPVHLTQDGQTLRGWQIAVPSTPHLLLKNKTRSRKRVLAAVRLAEKLGAKVVGLGGLTSSLTDKGTYLIAQKLRCKLTTGHSLTVATVIHTAKRAASIKGISFETAVIAIVGACGSIGSACSRWLVEENVNHLVLNDVHDEALTALKNELSGGSCTRIETTTDLAAVSRADILLVATNRPELIIKQHHFKSGCVVIDDAQPPNVGPSTTNGNKVLLAWGGLLNIPGINLHLDLGLAGKNTVFSCLGETIILATLGVENTHAVGTVDTRKARIIFSIATDLGISLAPLQAFGQLVEAESCDLLTSKTAMVKGPGR